MGQKQGAEDEAEGRILKYVAEAGFRGQSSRGSILTRRLFIFLPQNSWGA